MEKHNLTHPLAPSKPHHLHQPLTSFSAPQLLPALKENLKTSLDTIK